MLIKTTSTRKPVNAVGYFTGGGRYGYLSIRLAQALEEESGLKLSKLFPGGLIGSSVGTIPASTAAFEMMSMKQLARLFSKELPLFMPYDPWFYEKQGLVDIRNMAREAFVRTTQLEAVSDRLIELGINTNIETARYALIKSGQAGKRYAQKESIANLYDREYMESIINKWFGSVTLSDAQNTLFLTSQVTDSDRRDSYDFYFIDPKKVREGSILAAENPTLDVSVADAIIGGTAMPLAFQAHHIPKLGKSFTDQAAVDTGSLQIAKLEQSLNNGLEMGLVQFDTFLEQTPITAVQHNAKGWLRAIADQSIVDNYALQVKRDAHKEYKLRLGKNYRRLIFSEDDLKQAPFNTNILDTSPEEVENMIVGMDEYLYRNRSRIIMPVVDFLVENLEAYETHKRGWRGNVARLVPFIHQEGSVTEPDTTLPPLLPEADPQLPVSVHKHP